jgi:hypothetical protein
LFSIVYLLIHHYSVHHPRFPVSLKFLPIQISPNNNNNPIMLPQSLLLLLSAAASTTLASPAPTAWTKRSSPPAQPLNGLPAPSTLTPAATLKYIALGLGHQNYSCASPSAAPLALGATAALFDIKTYVSLLPALVPTLPGLQLALSTLKNDILPPPQNAGTDQADYSTNLLGFNRIGTHFFAADHVPTFSLTGVSPPAALSAAKAADVPAPPGSCQGPDGSGAVDWLLLKDNGQGRSSGGLLAVYRVETAGGLPPATCAGVVAGGVIRVPYAAEYWLYGQ